MEKKKRQLADDFLAKPRESIMLVIWDVGMAIDLWQINYRMRVTLNDGRQMTGQMLAFDKVAISIHPSFNQLHQAQRIFWDLGLEQMANCL